MSTEKNTRASFQRLDRPIDPDPAFAANLRSRFHATAAEHGDRPTRRPRVLPNLCRGLSPWVQALVAACLLLSVATGLILFIHQRSAPAVIEAPETVATALTSYGAAVRDGRWPGPGPANSEYTLGWRDSYDSSVGTLMSINLLPSGNYLYRFSESTEQAGYSVIAQKITNGEVVWQQPALLSHPFATTPNGVVVIQENNEPRPDNPQYGPSVVPGRVTLLDGDTGRVVWQSVSIYPIRLQVMLPLVATQERVLFLDADGVLRALSLRTGQEVWSYRSGEKSGLAITDPLPLCNEAAVIAISLAATDDVTYLYDPRVAEVTALGTGEGAVRWKVDTASRTGDADDMVMLTAVDEGVIARACPSSRSSAPRYIGLWSGKDGIEVWANSLRQTDLVIASDRTAYVSYPTTDDPRLCCALGEIDLQTGKMAWNDESRPMQLIGMIPSANMLLLFYPQEPRTVGIDPETHDVVWTQPDSMQGCYLRLPISPDHSIVCEGANGEVLVYHPGP